MLEMATTKAHCSASFQPEGQLGFLGLTVMWLSAVVMTKFLAKSTAHLSTSFRGFGIDQLATGSLS